MTHTGSTRDRLVRLAKIVIFRGPQVVRCVHHGHAGIADRHTRQIVTHTQEMEFQVRPQLPAQLLMSALDCPNENSCGQRQRTGTPVSKATGGLGRLALWNMNSRHSKVTDGVLGYVAIEKEYTILDLGCGGGRTLSKLAERAKQGRSMALIVPRRASPQARQRIHAGSMRGALRSTMVLCFSSPFGTECSIW